MAGDIARIDGTERFGLARLDADGSLDAGFAPVIAGPIRAVARLASGDIVIGGDFTRVNGVERTRLARLHADGSLDTAFAPQFDKEVLALAVQPDGRLLVGGQFTLVDGACPATLWFAWKRTVAWTRRSTWAVGRASQSILAS